MTDFPYNDDFYDKFNDDFNDFDDFDIDLQNQMFPFSELTPQKPIYDINLDDSLSDNFPYNSDVDEFF